jgi:hypothetical protein
LKLSAENGLVPKFHLALIPPDVEPPAGWDGMSDFPGSITPANYMTYSGVEYVTGPTYAFYVITGEYPGRLDGAWDLFPVGGNGVTDPPTYPVPVVVGMATSTDVVMEVSFDQSSYELDEHVVIHVTLFEGGQIQGSHTVGGGPITDANVTAEVILPSTGQTQTIPLTHSGNGLYAGQFTNTSSGGTYDFNVCASGILPTAQQPFTRKLVQSIYVFEPYTDIALFAENSLTINDGTTINSGDILVNRKSQPGDPGVELSIGTGVETPAGYAVKADRVQISDRSTIGGDLYYNELTNAGTINGDMISPLLLPVKELPPFETTDPAVVDAEDFTVDNRVDATISPDTYRDITLQPHSSLTMSPGEYHFRDFLAKSDTKIYFEGPTTIHVLHGLSGDNSSYFGPANGSTVSASEVVIYVQGTDGESSYPQSVNLNPKSVVFANLYAPNGTMLIDKQAKVTGAFLAHDLVIASNVRVTLASAFADVGRSSPTAKPVAQEPENGDVPTTYVLSQNYPNPFNPSTQIRYGLPEASHVTLTIYNMIGQEVVRLVDDVQAEGYHVVRWNGTNDFGNTVSTGMYIFRLTAEGFVQTKKMMLLK